MEKIISAKVKQLLIVILQLQRHSAFSSRKFSPVSAKVFPRLRPNLFSTSLMLRISEQGRILCANTLRLISFIVLLSWFITLFCANTCFSQRDTVNGIAWEPIIQLSPDNDWGPFIPTVAVQGDTVHMTYWGGVWRHCPYLRSIDGGKTFEPIRRLVSDSVGDVQHCWIVSGGRRLHIFFMTINRNMFHSYHMYSDDRGATWSAPALFPEPLGYPNNGSFSALGDTVAFVSAGIPSDNFYHVTVSSDGGEHWITQLGYRFQGNNPTVLVTSGVIHLVQGWTFDSAGHYYEYVTQYKRSTDLGLSWSDSISLSTVYSDFSTDVNPQGYHGDVELNATVDPTGGAESSKVFAAWTDETYGCLSIDGCSIVGRWSSDNGRTWAPPRRFDGRPAGVLESPVVRGKLMAVEWNDDYWGEDPWLPSRHHEYEEDVMATISADGGATWTPPYPLMKFDVALTNATALTATAVHVAIEAAKPTFYIYYRRGVILPAQSTISLTMRSGWNLFALPYRIPNPRVSVLFPFAPSPAYYYADRYVATDTLQPGVGYWLKADQFTCAASFSGMPVLPETIALKPGWNMIGLAGGRLQPVNSLRFIPDTIKLSHFFGFGVTAGRGYYEADTLAPAQGYWVKTSESGLIVVDSIPSGIAGKKAGLQLRRYSSLKITDAAGNNQVLYFGTAEGGSAIDWLMPPPAPGGAFDCRFKTGTMAEFVTGKELKNIPVLIASGTYPVTINWNVEPESPPAQLAIGGFEIPLKNDGSTKVYDASSSVVLKLNSVSPLPKEFALEQNYPNPFNPVTRIRFALPVGGMISLQIYDVFGREVATLVNGRMEAGEHVAEWNAVNEASGVYFYRLKRQDANGGMKSYVMKMLLVK